MKIRLYGQVPSIVVFNACKSREQGLQAKHFPDMPLPHAQDVVNPDLFLPALDEKAVSVEKEDHREKRHDSRPKTQAGVQRTVLRDTFAAAEGPHDVVHHHRQRPGEQVGEIGLPVVSQIGQGQPSINRTTQPSHLLLSAPSAYPRSSGTSARW